MGGGGSKTASVQKGVARAAAAAPKPPLGAAAAAEEAGISAAGDWRRIDEARTMKYKALLASPCALRLVAAERQREAELLRRRQEVAAQPQEQRQDNEGLVTSMNRAMAGMRQYQYQLYRNPEVGRRAPPASRLPKQSWPLLRRVCWLHTSCCWHLQVDKQYAMPKLTKEEKERDREGRLAVPVLKQLLEEHAAWVTAALLALFLLSLGQRYARIDPRP